MYKLFILLLISGLSLLSHIPLFAQQVDPVSGLTIKTGIKNDSPYKLVTRWDGYNIGTSGTEIFNDAGSVTAQAGMVDVLGYTNKSFNLKIAGLQDAGTTTFTCYTANGTTSVWSELFVLTFNGTTTFSMDIEENPEFTRFGAKRTGNNGATITLRELYSK